MTQDDIWTAALHALADSLPPDLRESLGGDGWRDATFGWSGVSVRRLAGGQYVKLVTRESHDLQPEYARLDWLAGRLSGQFAVPRVLTWAENDDFQLLAMSEIPGLMSFDNRFRDRPAEIVRVVAAGLRRIHALDITGCPFDRRADALIAQAQDQIAAGRVDHGALHPRWQERPLPALVDWLRDLRPVEDDPVFAHGDYSMPNVLLDPDSAALTGFIDWGRAGIADRRLDLVIAARSVAYNLGEDWVPPFYAAYGVPPPDPARRDFYLLADEFG